MQIYHFVWNLIIFWYFYLWLFFLSIPLTLPNWPINLNNMRTLKWQFFSVNFFLLVIYFFKFNIFYVKMMWLIEFLMILKCFILNSLKFLANIIWDELWSYCFSKCYLHILWKFWPLHTKANILWEVLLDLIKFIDQFFIVCQLN